MSFTDFDTKVLQINDWKIIRLPEDISRQLSSRGMGMAEVIINKEDLIVTLEPDGMSGHWFKISEEISKALDLKTGDAVSVSIKPLDEWIEPDVPVDFSRALKSSNVQENWDKLTTRSHWEWIRWIRSTANPETREKRIQVACSKLESGMKRPCCFDQTRSSEPEVSKSGILMTDIE